ncbi:monocarboxylate transporter 13-like [Cherax quadricarinatus]|uniref:monocarboxylate transporter 13-like n=1 Tax=Cherax quadricarinatus TaxID=27406 RepID=UPI00387EC0D3
MSKCRLTGDTKVENNGYYNRAFYGEEMNESVQRDEDTCIEMEYLAGRGITSPEFDAAVSDLRKRSQCENTVIHTVWNGVHKGESDAKEKENEMEKESHKESVLYTNEEGQKLHQNSPETDHHPGTPTSEKPPGPPRPGASNIAIFDSGNDSCTDGEDKEVPDGGWGYVVTAGCFIIMNLTNIYGPCFGILFSSFLLELKASSATITWIFNIQSFMFSFSSVFLMPLVKRFGWRCVTFIGGVFTAVGLAMSAFATSHWFLLCSYSLLGGIGCGVSTVVPVLVLTRYFKRRLGRANAFMVGGVCTGQMLGPPLVTYLQEEYGFKGATLIVAALMLNTSVASVVFHPVEWHTKSPSNVKKLDNNRSSSRSQEYGVGATLVKMICSLGKQLKILQNARVVIFAVAGNCVFSSYLNFFVLVPFVMEAGGFSQEEASWCMSVSAASNLATRLLVSSLADWSWFSIRGCFMAGIFVVAVSTAGRLNNSLPGRS